MALEFFFGIALLIVVIYILFRIVGNVALGAILIMMVFLSSYLLLGSFPSFRDVPVIGAFVPTTGKTIAVVKDFAYSMDIIGVSTSSNGNLLVTVANTGQLELSNFTARVNEQNIDILNNRDSLKSGDVIVFELDWNQDFQRVIMRTDNAEARYEKP